MFLIRKCSKCNKHSFTFSQSKHLNLTPSWPPVVRFISYLFLIKTLRYDDITALITEAKNGNKLTLTSKKTSRVKYDYCLARCSEVVTPPTENAASTPRH